MVADSVVVGFDSGVEPDKLRHGGKGAGLVRMSSMGIPVPPGFIIGTEAGRAYLSSGELPEGLEESVATELSALEAKSGRSFGDDANPLLVSVRSGAPVSMPGMMDTVLNLGLTPAGAETLAAQTGDTEFAQSSLERLLHGFATTVRGIGAGLVEEALLDLPAGASPADRTAALLTLIETESGSPFPDPRGQLTETIEAIFRSWNSRRAKAYRKKKGISEEMGTAVVVQLMAFGNRSDDSGSGVLFTRDPSTGEKGMWGDVLFRAQGEDVVSGERDALNISALAERMPSVAAELEEVATKLEADSGDMCDIEFTIEEGRLWILQTRSGQRTGRAAVRIAVEMTEEGLIDEATAVERVTDEQLEAARSPRFAEPLPDEAIVGRGLAASPGAGVGSVVLTPESAMATEDGGPEPVLVRPTTSPSDLPGLLASGAVVTFRGGRASHAAVVARGLDKPAVCGTGHLDLAEGEIVSVDGDRGVVARGEFEPSPPEDDPTLNRFLSWRSK